MTRLASTLLASSLAAGVLGAGSSSPPLPDHPSKLVFPASRWRFPTAAEASVRLPSGATAFVVPDTTLPLVDLIVVARAGAHLDPPELRGLAEMTTTLLRRGGAGARSADEFDRRADELGARLYSVPTILYGAAGLRCTSDVLEEAIELLLDMVERPRFEEDRWTSVKANAAEALSRRNLDGAMVLEREWDWLMYGESHFSTRPVRSSDLDKLTPEALREFHRRQWRPENFFIAAGGDLDIDQLRELVEPRFRAWSPSAAPPGSWPPPPPSERAEPGLFHVDAHVPQARVALGHRAPELPSAVEDRIELEVLAEILAGRGAISRLNGRLRSAKGLVYRVWSDFDPGDLWPADYQVRFDTLAANTPAAVEATLEEIWRLRAQPPHPEELAVVQRELVARRYQEFDTAEEAAGYLVEDALVSRPGRYRAEYRDLVERVTGEQVLAAARLHLRPEELVVLVSGPWDQLAGPGDGEGWTRLERIVGHRVVHLEERDPLSLEPAVLDPP